MICSNCGGEYAKTDLFCPYCNQENVIMAEQIKREKLDRLEQEENEIRKLPQKRMKKSVKIMFISGLAVIGIFLIIIITSYVFGRVEVKKAYKIQSEQMAILEGYYQAGNLKELSAYINENSIYQSRYEKYVKLARAYEQSERMKSNIDDFIEMTEQETFSTWDETRQEEFCVSYIYYATYAGIQTCILCREGMEEYGEVDNTELVQELYDQSIDRLVNQLHYTQNDIDEMCRLESLSEGNMKPYCEKAYAAWKKAVQ